MMEMKGTISEREIAILKHTLGYNYQPKHDRNFFCVEIGSDDYEICKFLEMVGFMERGRRVDDALVYDGELWYFHATEKGHIFLKGEL